MRELVSTTFANGWLAAEPLVPLALENETLPSSDSFALLTIQLTTSLQMTQGAPSTRRVQRNGWISVKLWGPANAGAMGVALLADRARTLLEMVDMPSPVTGDEPVTTLAGVTRPAGTDSRWYMCVVQVPFWYSQTK